MFKLIFLTAKSTARLFISTIVTKESGFEIAKEIPRTPYPHPMSKALPLKGGLILLINHFQNPLCF